jgi:hypothetical protein
MTLVSHPLKMRYLGSILVALLGLLYILRNILHFQSIQGSLRNPKESLTKMSTTTELVSQAKELSLVHVPELRRAISIPSLQKRLSSPSSKRLTKAVSYPILNVYLGSEVLNITRVTQTPSKSEDTYYSQGLRHGTRYMKQSQQSEKNSSDPYYMNLKNREL